MLRTRRTRSPELLGSRVFELSGKLNLTHEDRLKAIEDAANGTGGTVPMSDFAARKLQLAIRLKADLKAYARSCLTIRDKDKAARPLIFNKAQQMPTKGRKTISIPPRWSACSKRPKAVDTANAITRCSC